MPIDEVNDSLEVDHDNSLDRLFGDHSQMPQHLLDPLILSNYSFPFTCSLKDHEYSMIIFKNLARAAFIIYSQLLQLTSIRSLSWAVAEAFFPA